MAVTEDVSLTAVPAKRAKPSLERWSQEPRVGKIRAAKTLKKKDNRNGLGYFFFLGVNNRSSRCNGRTANRIEDPTPINVASFVSRLKKRWKKKAIIKAIEW